MNCLKFRRLCQVDPYIEDSVFFDHKHTCPSCKSYYQKVMDFECGLEEALTIQVPDELSSRIILKQSIDPVYKKNHLPLQILFALAATIVLTVGLVVWLSKPGSHYDLDRIALDFYNRNPAVLATNRPPEAEKSFKYFLAEIGIGVRKNIEGIEHVERCYVRDKQGIYVVMGGIKGPVTVLFMPEESVVRKKLFADKDYYGVIVPCPKGSIAIIGKPGENLEQIDRKLRASLEWF